MVLVHHNVEPDLVTKRELVQETVQHLMAGCRIEILVRKIDSERTMLRRAIPRWIITHFGEVKDAHHDAPL